MFDDTKLKYVRLARYNEVIIFPSVIEHKDFRNFEPASAGFCYVNDDSVKCFGESFSLGLKSDPKDSFHATKQVHGIEDAMKLIDTEK